MPLFVAEFQFRYNKCENADIWGKAIDDPPPELES
jgi:hypothetical protein